MTLFIDDDYAWLSLMLRPECERRNIPLETSDLNTRGFGDVLYVTDAGTYSGEIKGAAEILGNISHCEAQLQKQMANADKCFLAVYGYTGATEDGNSTAWQFKQSRLVYEHGNERGYANTSASHYFRTNYLGYRTFLARLVSMGVDVYEVPSREALATQLVALYHTLTTEGDTLRRVIVEKPRVQEQDPAKARFMRQLMGLEAGIGEELAEAVAGWMARVERPLTINALSYRLDPDDDIFGEHAADLSTQPLRSGKRTVGPAAVQRLKDALGL